MQVGHATGMKHYRVLFFMFVLVALGSKYMLAPLVQAEKTARAHAHAEVP
jgi:hypothetical protein